MATRQAAPRRRGATSGDDGGRTAATRSRAQRARRRRRRYAVVYDIEGPRVRLGMLWFVVASVAVVVGPLPTALVYGGTAAVAGAQTARTWHRRSVRPDPGAAAVMAGSMALGGCLGAGGGGAGILLGVAVALGSALAGAGSVARSISNAGWSVQCGLFPGFAALSMVLLTRLDQGSAVALLLLVSAYETGDYLVGSGAHNPYEGPAAGLAAVVVVTFIVSTLPFTPLSFGEAWLFGGVVAVLAPVGQLFASALLPTAGAPASALRRLDSLLLAAPAWCIGVAIVLG